MESLDALRAERREELRGRNNVTSCRSPPRESSIKRDLRRKRQDQFHQRRSFSPERSVDLQTSQASPRSQDEMIRRQRVSTSSRVTRTTRSARDDGSENLLLRTRDSTVQTDNSFITVQESEIQQLAEYLKEALWREDSVKQKLLRLQKNTSNLVKTSDDVWTTRCNEDLLRNQINGLEQQLHICLQRSSKDDLKTLLVQREKQTLLHEHRAVIALQKITQEKMEASSKADTLQEAFISTRAEVLRWQGLYEGQEVKCVQLRRQRQDLEQQLQQQQVSTDDLREEVESLREELQNHKSLLDQQNQVSPDQVQTEGAEETTKVEQEVDAVKEDEQLQSERLLLEQLQSERLLLEQLQSERLLLEQLQSERLLLEQLQSERLLLEQLQSERLLLQQEHHSSQTRRAERGPEHKRLRTSACASCWKVCVVLLLLAVATATMLWAWHPPFRDQVQDLLWDVRARVQDHMVRTPGHCFRPV